MKMPDFLKLPKYTGVDPDLEKQMLSAEHLDELHSVADQLRARIRSQWFLSSWTFRALFLRVLLPLILAFCTLLTIILPYTAFDVVVILLVVLTLHALGTAYYYYWKGRKWELDGVSHNVTFNEVRLTFDPKKVVRRIIDQQSSRPTSAASHPSPEPDYPIRDPPHQAHGAAGCLAVLIIVIGTAIGIELLFRDSGPLAATLVILASLAMAASLFLQPDSPDN